MERAPHLEDYEVDPDPGLPSDEFTFRVTYLDDEGVAPESVKLVLDGTDYTMKLEGKVRSYADGAVFSTTVKELTWGPHVSQFVASDGVHITMTDPQPMPYVEGDDLDWNEAPYLEEDGVEPWDGTPAEEFVFRVIYTDDENDVPAYVRLLLDGQPIEMNLVGKAGKYYQGVTYEASVTNLRLGAAPLPVRGIGRHNGGHHPPEPGPHGRRRRSRLELRPRPLGRPSRPRGPPRCHPHLLRVLSGTRRVTRRLRPAPPRQEDLSDEGGLSQEAPLCQGRPVQHPSKSSGKGPHSFVFEASDGSNQTDTDLLGGPWIEGEPNNKTPRRLSP